MAVSRGSSPLFTIAVVVFESSDDAARCQKAVESLRAELRMGPRAEFHFHGDSHERRQLLLDTLRHQRFKISAFTLNKTSPRLSAPGYQHKESLYKNVCKMAIENCVDLLVDARVVIDSSGDRDFKRQFATYLRRSLGGEAKNCVKEVVLKRSQSDPLIQVADYAASVVNRAHANKPGGSAYLAMLRRRIHRDRVWPALE